MLKELDTLIQLTFGDASQSEAPIFIDTRSDDAKILDAIPGSDEPAVKVTIKPEYIIQFHEGGLDPRLGMFKDALFHEPSMPKGDIPKAVRFADLLTPNPPVGLEDIGPFEKGELPTPTEDVSQLRKDIKKWGYGYASR